MIWIFVYMIFCVEKKGVVIVIKILWMLVERWVWLLFRLSFLFGCVSCVCLIILLSVIKLLKKRM